MLQVWFHTQRVLGQHILDFTGKKKNNLKLGEEGGRDGCGLAGAEEEGNMITIDCMKLPKNLIKYYINKI